MRKPLNINKFGTCFGKCMVFSIYVINTAVSVYLQKRINMCISVKKMSCTWMFVEYLH